MPNDNDATGTKRLLSQLLAELLMCFPDVTFIDHKHREWSFTATDDEERFRKEFETAALQIHPIKNRQMRIIRWVAITKVRAATTIPDWKNNDYFSDQIIEAKIYLFPHPFGYDEWDITSIGFIKGIHVVHFSQGHLRAR